MLTIDPWKTKNGGQLTMPTANAGARRRERVRATMSDEEPLAIRARERNAAANSRRYR
jgi:hypothetical protein